MQMSCEIQFVTFGIALIVSMENIYEKPANASHECNADTKVSLY
jgi:hypothetical protein